MISSVSYNPMNGRLTAGCALREYHNAKTFSYEVAQSQQDSSNHWSSTENNRNNARNVNFNSGNANNNNKYNSNVVRPVSAFQDYAAPVPFLPFMPFGISSVASAASRVAPSQSFVASVWDAYRDCLRGKMRSKQALEYMEIAETDIPKLASELWSGTYTPGTSTCFLVHYPKLREVFAASFRDRIVHHWICLRINPLFEHRFIAQGNVSFNCRKGFGTEKAVEHVAEGMRRVSNNYRRQAWVFRGDLVGFFMSINKDLLWHYLQRFMLRWKTRSENNGWEYYGLAGMPEMYWPILFRATYAVVMHHPENDCILNTDPKEWLNLATNKSLFTSPTGEPIGNLTTQLFANFLMSHFVTYVQWLYRHHDYCFAQFVDDFIIVCDNLNFLVKSIPLIEKFLRDKMLLSLHKDKRYIQPVSHGVKFVGTFIKPSRLYLSNRTLARMRNKCYGYGKLLVRNPDQIGTHRIEQVINSYLGFTHRRRTYKLRRQYLELLGGNFWKYFYIKGHHQSIKQRKHPIIK